MAKIYSRFGLIDLFTAALTKKKKNFVWGPAQQAAFAKLKEHMICLATLGYFDVGDRTQLVADASPVGLGAVLIQVNKQGSRPGSSLPLVRACRIWKNAMRRLRRMGGSVAGEQGGSYLPTW